MSAPRFAKIKNHILLQIEQRKLSPGDRVPSENELMSLFDVSRMTARRALHELANEGTLVRTQGLGSFVADARPMSSMLEIRNIAEEIEQRGHVHSCRVLALNTINASPEQAIWLSVREGDVLYSSTLIHYENNRALQYEHRLVNPAFAPDYLEQDFSRLTPNAYLTQAAPLTEADHIVEAVCVDQTIADQLQITTHQPCLKVSRRTWSRQGIVSFACLYHPGDRYRLGGHLNFSSKQM